MLFFLKFNGIKVWVEQLTQKLFLMSKNDGQICYFSVFFHASRGYTITPLLHYNFQYRKAPEEDRSGALSYM